MYPNQYGNQPPQNFGFGQLAQGGVPPYPPSQNPGGLPYPMQPSAAPGFAQNPSPYPQQNAAYPPQLPSGQQPFGYNQPAGYPPQNQGAYPGGPNQSVGGYPPTAGYNTNPQGGYPPVPNQPPVGAYPNVPPPSTGYSQYPAPGQHSAYSTQPNAPSAAYPSHSFGGQPGQQPAGYPSNPPYGSTAAPPSHQPSAYPTQPSHQASAYPTQQFTSTQAHSYGADPHAASRGLPSAGPVKMQAYVDRPTVIGGHFDPAADAQALRKAMKGFGTDEAAIMNVICRRTNAQRLQIANAFKTSFGKDLISDLKSELGGRLEEVILALMTPRFDYLAMTVQKAISGIGTKERSLVDTLCTSTNEEIRLIVASYARLYGRSLERDLMGDTSGHFRRLLVSSITGGRMESQQPDQAMAVADAQALYNAGANKIGTDEATFNQILCLRSFPHLRLVFHEYERTYGQSFEKVIEREFSGDIESGLKAVVACAKNRAAYFASRLHESFAGFGTKDDDLVFIMVTRCEIDMGNIKEDYQRNYNKSLASAIASETSGDYKKALITLLGE